MKTTIFKYSSKIQDRIRIELPKDSSLMKLIYNDETGMIDFYFYIVSDTEPDAYMEFILTEAGENADEIRMVNYIDTIVYQQRIHRLVVHVFKNGWHDLKTGTLIGH